jgi:hypothetical protein
LDAVPARSPARQPAEHRGARHSASTSRAG